MKRIFKISAFLFALFIALAFHGQSAKASTINYVKSNVAPDKVWTISFNQNVDAASLSAGYVYVKDSSGNSIAVSTKVDPTNPKQIIVTPKTSYDLGKTYILTVSKALENEKGSTLSDDVNLQFTIKRQLVDSADFKVQTNSAIGVSIISINSVTSPDIKKFKVEGEDEADGEVNIGDEAYVIGKYQNVNVYFYDENGNQVGNSLINIEKSCDSQVVQITN